MVAVKARRQSISYDDFLVDLRLCVCVSPSPRRRCIDTHPTVCTVKHQHTAAVKQMSYYVLSIVSYRSIIYAVFDDISRVFTNACVLSLGKHI